MKKSNSQKEKPSILALGVNVTGSGFSRVLDTLMENLKTRYRIHYIGIGYRGEPIDKGWKIYPCNQEGGDLFGRYQAQRFIEQNRPEIVFILNDIWVMEHYEPMLKEFKDDLSIVTYTPFDGALKRDEMLIPFTVVDRFVVYKEFAKESTKRSLTRLSNKLGNLDFPEIEVIPHGVDTKKFYPLVPSVDTLFKGEKRLKAKQSIFPNEDHLPDSFIVLNANRPTERKRIDLTIEGFALFAQNKPSNVLLCLHHGIISDSEREKVINTAKQCNIMDRLRLNPCNKESSYVDDQKMNIIYNACDVGINTSMGEGWGLVSFEHAATGAAQIIPRHSGSEDLWEEGAELVEPTGPSAKPAYVNYPLEMNVVSPENIATALEKLYQDKEYLEAMSIAAYQTALKPQYDWKDIAWKWDSLFSNLLK
ncbi:MAG: glycosyltransferase family 4 protein [Candidatus Scalindua sp.]|jgi:glycosyltransferase involved in cell wall biosynthesis|nr:glycosyltransferase family 4 protein [Candidatus Scalindua sp.]MBT5304099.1 glycosyltransferase family 4 protein [Candidatus Scalindua sp.]MBT6053685.1 glycosyltransferase family 4 protein [Candidatus Scalindua sp.]MBT6231249.1 glycosyltransferase family 4 protein [Candidatus Scalindua sp.]MBT6564873.1 glycosyltransferase family 4 protein [Candidatus Scalindua sp.]